MFTGAAHPNQRRCTLLEIDMKYSCWLNVGESDRVKAEVDISSLGWTQCEWENLSEKDKNDIVTREIDRMTRQYIEDGM